MEWWYLHVGVGREGDYDVTYAESETSDPYFGKKIAGGHYASGEASYIEYIGGYYYLFMSYGGLAAGGVPTDYVVTRCACSVHRLLTDLIWTARVAMLSSPAMH